MIAHTGLPVSDYKKAKEFYIKALAPLGYTNNMEYGEAAGFIEGGHTSFWIATNPKGVVPLHVAFEAKNKEQVDEFYKVAIAAGARDNGAPGYRKEYWPGYYAAFVHDPHGHNVEVVWYAYSHEEKK